MFRLLALASLAAVALATGPPAYAPHPAPAYHPAAPEPAQPYAFQYGVADDYSGANFAASENSDAKTTSGSYTVNLPDGRVQTVTYTADDYTGFVADVAYTGTASYPEEKAYHPAPVHKAAPVYHAAPAPVYHPAPAPVYPPAPAPAYHA